MLQPGQEADRGAFEPLCSGSELQRRPALPNASTTHFPVSAFKLVRYVLDPNQREWLPIETFIGSADRLERELRSLIRGRPIVVDVFAPNGDCLNLGIGGPVGYAAFATQDMVREGRATISHVGTVGEDVPEWVEFEMGGTPTPINRSGLVTAEELISIVKQFFETGELHPRFTWE